MKELTTISWTVQTKCATLAFSAQLDMEDGRHVFNVFEVHIREGICCGQIFLGRLIEDCETMHQQ